MNRIEMYAVVITDEGGVRRRLDFSKSEVTVGRVQGNDIVLAKRNVSKQHARLRLEGNQAIVVDLGSTNGTWVNGRKITSPQPLKKGDKIYIADFILTLEPANDDAERQSKTPSLSEPPPIPSQSTAPPPASRPVRAQMMARSPAPEESRPPRAGDIRGTSLPPSIEQRATDAPAPPSAAAPAAGDPLSGLLTRLANRIDIDTADPEAMKAFGNTVVVWDLHARKPIKVLDVPGAPLEVRCAWNEKHDYCFTTTALTSKVWLIYLDEQGEWQSQAVGDIGDAAKIPLPVDISITNDDKHLWINTSCCLL